MRMTVDFDENNQDHIKELLDCDKNGYIGQIFKYYEDNGLDQKVFFSNSENRDSRDNDSHIKLRINGKLNQDLLTEKKKQYDGDKSLHHRRKTKM
jgi:hypothetical protein